MSAVVSLFSTTHSSAAKSPRLTEHVLPNCPSRVSAVLRQVEASLQESKDTVAQLRKMLDAAKAEAKDNLFFKEK